MAPQVDTATTKALRYMARTKQHRTYLPYTFPAEVQTSRQVQGYQSLSLQSNMITVNQLSLYSLVIIYNLNSF